MTSEQIVTKHYPHYGICRRPWGVFEVIVSKIDANSPVVGIGDTKEDAITDAAARLSTY